MEYTVIDTNDQWGYELRDAYGRYVGNALTTEQLNRFAEAEGARLHFAGARNRGAGAGPVWTDWLRVLAGRLWPTTAGVWS